jgi:hypothetical protein
MACSLEKLGPIPESVLARVAGAVRFVFVAFLSFDSRQLGFFYKTYFFFFLGDGRGDSGFEWGGLSVPEIQSDSPRY